MSQYSYRQTTPIYTTRAHSKYEQQQYNSTTRYTSCKNTEWHLKYQSKDRNECAPSLQFMIKSELNKENYNIQNRRQSYQNPQLQYFEFPKQEFKKSKLTYKFDIQNFVSRLNKRLDNIK